VKSCFLSDHDGFFAALLKKNDFSSIAKHKGWPPKPKDFFAFLQNGADNRR